MAGRGVAIVSPTNLVRIICGLVVCDLRLPAFLGATSCSNITAELSGIAEAIRWANSYIFRRARLRILVGSKHAARVTIGTAHAEKIISFARTCNELLLRLKCNFHVSAHHVYGHAGNMGNDCADAAASLKFSIVSIKSRKFCIQWLSSFGRVVFGPFQPQAGAVVAWAHPLKKTNLLQDWRCDTVGFLKLAARRRHANHSAGSATPEHPVTSVLQRGLQPVRFSQSGLPTTVSRRRGFRDVPRRRQRLEGLLAYSPALFVTQTRHSFLTCSTSASQLPSSWTACSAIYARKLYSTPRRKRLAVR